MAEDGKAKYAAEIWELFRLFSRIGRSAYGLILILIGWAFLIKTGRETLTSKDTVQAIVLPDISSWNPLQVTWYHPSVSMIVIVGILSIIVWWLWYSRLLVYVLALSRHAIRPVAIIFVCLFPIVVSVINFVLLPLIIIFSAQVRKYRRDNFRLLWLKKHQEELPKETRQQHKEAWKSYVLSMQEQHGKEGFDSIITHASWQPSNYMLAKAATHLTLSLLRSTLSRCRVGLAPVAAQSYIEEFNASKLPMQVFAQAITRVRTELSELSLLDRIDFVELPPSARMQHWSEATSYARLFDTDVLLWGTFKADPAFSISMNLLNHNCRQKEDDDIDQYGSEYQRRFFPWRINVNVPALSFNQDDAEEVYLVLVIAQILALQSVEKRWEVGLRRVFADFKVLDKLSIYANSTIQEILLRVMPSALMRLGVSPIPDTTPTSGRSAFVDLAGQWIGSILHVGVGSEFENLSKRKGRASTIATLKEMAEVCVMLKPQDAIAHYRLGALHVLSDAPEAAIGSFRYAGELEKRSFLVHEIGARVAADMTDYEFSQNEELALAVWAAHAACAINTGSEYAMKKIREVVDTKLPNKLNCYLLEKPEPAAIIVIKLMLSDEGV